LTIVTIRRNDMDTMMMPGTGEEHPLQGPHPTDMKAA